MNEAGYLLVWCSAQVTLVALMGAALYSLARRLCPPAAASTALVSLVFLIVLGLLALSARPNWLVVVRRHVERWQARLQAERETAQAEKQAASRSSQPAMGVASKPVAQSTNAKSEPPRSLKPAMTPIQRRVHASDENSPLAARAWSQLWLGLREMGYNPRDTRWQWPATLGLILLLGAALGLLRLGAGLACLMIYPCLGRRVSDPRLLELVDEIRREFGCRRRIILRESLAVTSAATAGWLRPLILLPGNWRTWTLDERRAVLAHEIAHVVRGDFAACLTAQFALALHFYHPLAHWLVRSLRVEQELAADAAAARIAGGQRVYLATLASLALREGTSSRHWLAASFLPSRGMLWRRVEALRSAPAGFSAPSVVASQILVFTALMATTLAVAGIRPLEAETEITDRVAQAAASPTPELPRP